MLNPKDVDDQEDAVSRITEQDWSEDFLTKQSVTKFEGNVVSVTDDSNKKLPKSLEKLPQKEPNLGTTRNSSRKAWQKALH